MKRVLVFGANAAIAEAVARELAPGGAAFRLLGRKPDQLDALAADLALLGAAATCTGHFDALDGKSFSRLVTEALNDAQPDLILFAWGSLPAQHHCDADTDLTRTALETNGNSVVLLLAELLQQLDPEQSTTIAVIGSPAGLRGRRTNYVYGAGKAMVTIFAEGARARFASTAIHVMTVIPGRVDTPMTADFDKGLLWSTPEQVAHCLLRGVERRSNVVYAPGYWRWILLVIRLLPEVLLRRLQA